ncbi:UNVERIFIED_CONTAM: hypothetical protein Scaly_1654500 [Sesamum calycinum]|uniref:RNase H type-1 domain-containing protein n=1 Tax=Sesamum calycinum TaxID=2727403 RepID=A0AAW2NS92_9LAMI
MQLGGAPLEAVDTSLYGLAREARKCYVEAIKRGKKRKTEEPPKIEDPNKLGNDPIPSLEPDKATSATVQPMEELLTIELTPSNPEIVTKIGSKMTENDRNRVINCLRRNKYIFAWTRQDLEGIDPGVISHHLNLDPSEIRKKDTSDLKKTKSSKMNEANLAKIKAILHMGPPHQYQRSTATNRKNVGLSRFISKSVEKGIPFFKTLREVRDIKWTEECQQALEELKAYLAKLPLLEKPVLGDTLYLYLSSTISLSAYRKDGPGLGHHGKETAALLPFLPHWSQNQYSLEASLRQTRSFGTISKMGNRERGPRRKTLASPRRRILHQKGSGTGIVITSPQGKDMEFVIRFDFKASNEAEYEALILGMRMAKDAGASHLLAYSNSQLIVKSMNGEYEAKEDSMASEQVKITNRIMVQGIKKRLDRAGGNWVEELTSVQWSYRPTPRGSTGKSPFTLVYGAEVIIWAELGIPLHRILHFNEESFPSY